jgi:DNA-binding NarL/FixJ family response regulator
MHQPPFRLAVLVADQQPLLDLATVLPSIDAAVVVSLRSAAEAMTLQPGDADLILVLVDQADAMTFREVLLLRPHRVRLPVFVLYRTLNLSNLILACEHGINGHGLQSLESVDLCIGLTAVRRRSLYLCPTIFAALSTRFQQIIDDLSDTSERILSMVAAGASSKTIATLLSVSRRTAEYHVDRLSRTLGAQNRSELAAFWGRISGVEHRAQSIEPRTENREPENREPENREPRTENLRTENRELRTENWEIREPGNKALQRVEHSARCIDTSEC